MRIGSRILFAKTFPAFYDLQAHSPLKLQFLKELRLGSGMESSSLLSQIVSFDVVAFACGSARCN